VIVSNAHVTKAVKAIQARFPDLTVQDLVYNVRFNSQRSEGRVGTERIDVVRDNVPLFKRVLERYSMTIAWRGASIRLPTTEATVALKFAAVISPNRGNDSRPQDRADLMAIVSQHRDLKVDVLGELGDLVYPGGGQELRDFCSAAWQGKRVSL
jgi:hypothetical protein